MENGENGIPESQPRQKKKKKVWWKKQKNLQEAYLLICGVQKWMSEKILLE